jgi:hypothetical protein
MRILILMLLSIAASPLQAGMYTALEPTPFRTSPDGFLQELPYVPPFKTFLEERLNASNPANPEVIDGRKTYRGILLERHRASGTKTIDGAVDAIRLGLAGEAVNLLLPRTRDRNLDYVALVTLAHAHAVRGEWDEAIRCHALATYDAEPPKTLPGANAEQTHRLVAIEKMYYARWLNLRKREANMRDGFAEQDVLGLFGPMTWTAGKLSEPDNAKLPPDAIAIVQQLILWAPDDTRLLWLLAELYAAKGMLREADQVFDQCTWGRSFTNRKILMDHRAIVRDLVAAMPAETVTELVMNEPDAEAQDAARWQEFRPKFYAGLGVLGVVATVFVVLALRRVLPRSKSGRR